MRAIFGLFLVVLLFGTCVSTLGCQMPEENYYGFTKTETEPASYYDNLRGTWCKKNDCFFITEKSEFFCNFGDEDEGVVVEYQQKYFRLDRELCGMGPIVGYQWSPPYTALQILTDGKVSTFLKR